MDNMELFHSSVVPFLPKRTAPAAWWDTLRRGAEDERCHGASVASGEREDDAEVWKGARGRRGARGKGSHGTCWAS